MSGCSAVAGSDESGTSAAGDCDVAPDFPIGPIELVVPYAAGGGTDSVSRILAEGMAERLGTQVNVLNQPGGGGAIGYQRVASQAPDGQTLVMAVSDLGMLHWLGLSDITPDDLSPVAQVNADPAGITVAADAEWDTLQDLLDDVESDPGGLVASGVGQGGIWHAALLGFLMSADLPADAIRWVPSDGAAPALQEVVAGGVDVVTASLAEGRTLHDSGDVRALAVMADERDPNFPDVPTVEEAVGIDYEMTVWRGLLGPEGMAEEVVQELDCTVAQVVESDDFIEFMDSSGLLINYRSTEDFSTFLREDDEAKGTILEEAGLTS
ncbi:tripartite tricarboxylate transporter substrate binding protein [Brevibacterium album]|uniref:tripartite tricarboxylate transporter substrate binding protein n=1 Tax=Brevibacterium album TaxID=417948 RepID=UPI00247FAD25|nr:tripartite tricarboxylate transporter substrate binding protein [Brevibacterium album]